MEEQKKDTATTDVTKKEDTIQDAEVVVSETPTEETKEAEKKTPFNKNMVFAFMAGVLIAFAGYFVFQSGTQGPTETDVELGTMSFVAESAVVATVNGEALNGKALNQQLDQFAQMSGAPNFASLDEATQQQIFSQAVDALVNSELIAQAAEESGLAVSDEEVADEYTRLVEQIGGGEAATERLTSLGTTEEEFKEVLARDLLISKYLEGEAGSLTASEEEIQEAYALVKESMGENTPALEDVRAQLEAQVLGEKQQTFLFDFLQKMRDDADIEVLI